jgi:hypothetical protein
MFTSTQRNDPLVADDTCFEPWAARAQAEVAGLYHQIEGDDQNNAAMAFWTQQLIAGLSAV